MQLPLCSRAHGAEAWHLGSGQGILGGSVLSCLGIAPATVAMLATTVAPCSAYYSVSFYSMTDAFQDTIGSGFINACVHMTLYSTIGFALESLPK